MNWQIFYLWLEPLPNPLMSEKYLRFNKYFDPKQTNNISLYQFSCLPFLNQFELLFAHNYKPDALKRKTGNFTSYTFDLQGSRAKIVLQNMQWMKTHIRRFTMPEGRTWDLMTDFVNSVNVMGLGLFDASSCFVDN